MLFSACDPCVERMFVVPPSLTLPVSVPHSRWICPPFKWSPALPNSPSPETETGPRAQGQPKPRDDPRSADFYVLMVSYSSCRYSFYFVWEFSVFYWVKVTVFCILIPKKKMEKKQKDSNQLGILYFSNSLIRKFTIKSTNTKNVRIS